MPGTITHDTARRPGGLREMTAMALPMVVSFACDTVMTFTDRWFLSRLSPAHMNAAMTGGITCFFMLSFFFGLVGYVTPLVAQYLGARRENQCPQIVTQALIIIAVVYPLILLLRPWVIEGMGKMGVPPDELNLQAQYFSWLTLGACFSLGRHALSSFFSGIGRTGTVMVASFLAMTVNAILNYGLIFGNLGSPRMGIRGAALGTILGSLSGFCFLLGRYLEKENRLRFGISGSIGFKRDLMAKLWKFGFPSGIELALNMMSFAGVIYLFHAQGSVVATASTILFNWDMVTFIPLIGVEVGVTSLVGRYQGAGQWSVARRTVRSAFQLGVIYAFLMLVLFVLFPEQLVNFFRPNLLDHVFVVAYPLAVSMVKLIAVYVFAEVVLIVFTGALRGAGDTFWAMVISVGMNWAILAILYAALIVQKSGAYAAWCLMVGFFTALTLLPYLRYRQGSWERIRMVDNQD